MRYVDGGSTSAYGMSHSLQVIGKRAGQPRSGSFTWNFSMECQIVAMAPFPAVPMEEVWDSRLFPPASSLQSRELLAQAARGMTLEQRGDLSGRPLRGRRDKRVSVAPAGLGDQVLRCRGGVPSTRRSFTPQTESWIASATAASIVA
jgi:hypothetical protein